MSKENFLSIEMLFKERSFERKLSLRKLKFHEFLTNF